MVVGFIVVSDLQVQQQLCGADPDKCSHIWPVLTLFNIIDLPPNAERQAISERCQELIARLEGTGGSAAFQALNLVHTASKLQDTVFRETYLLSLPVEARWAVPLHVTPQFLQTGGDLRRQVSVYDPCLTCMGGTLESQCSACGGRRMTKTSVAFVLTLSPRTELVLHQKRWFRLVANTTVRFTMDPTTGNGRLAHTIDYDTARYLRPFQVPLPSGGIHEIDPSARRSPITVGQEWVCPNEGPPNNAGHATDLIVAIEAITMPSELAVDPRKLVLQLETADLEIARLNNQLTEASSQVSKQRRQLSGLTQRLETSQMSLAAELQARSEDRELCEQHSSRVETLQAELSQLKALLEPHSQEGTPRKGLFGANLFRTRSKDSGEPQEAFESLQHHHIQLREEMENLKAENRRLGMRPGKPREVKLIDKGTLTEGVSPAEMQDRNEQLIAQLSTKQHLLNLNAEAIGRMEHTIAELTDQLEVDRTLAQLAGGNWQLLCGGLVQEFESFHRDMLSQKADRNLSRLRVVAKAECTQLTPQPAPQAPVADTPPPPDQAEIEELRECLATQKQKLRRLVNKLHNLSEQKAELAARLEIERLALQQQNDKQTERMEHKNEHLRRKIDELKANRRKHLSSHTKPPEHRHGHGAAGDTLGPLMRASASLQQQIDVEAGLNKELQAVQADHVRAVEQMNKVRAANTAQLTSANLELKCQLQHTSDALRELKAAAFATEAHQRNTERLEFNLRMTTSENTFLKHQLDQLAPTRSTPLLRSTSVYTSTRTCTPQPPPCPRRF
eukprot:NODE_211_length_2674_cov_20.281508_g197_i0.p1 GENE.NODE_211_length_2674_cov_20.281508_g197_i0~~NODE_211_length_2674_cov_20.281508_g197_i0.p1  ORF type:complete len:804 (-),score=203.81 NODE_211_length_2674_cov_20.281508_g197_i0:263-2629(-)